MVVEYCLDKFIPLIILYLSRRVKKLAEDMWKNLYQLRGFPVPELLTFAKRYVIIHLINHVSKEVDKMKSLTLMKSTVILSSAYAA